MRLQSVVRNQQLHAVAGRQDHRLFHTRLGQQCARRLRQDLFGNRQPLAQPTGAVVWLRPVTRNLISVQTCARKSERNPACSRPRRKGFRTKTPDVSHAARSTRNPALRRMNNINNIEPHITEGQQHLRDRRNTLCPPAPAQSVARQTTQPSCTQNQCATCSSRSDPSLPTAAATSRSARPLFRPGQHARLGPVLAFEPFILDTDTGSSTAC